MKDREKDLSTPNPLSTPAEPEISAKEQQPDSHAEPHGSAAPDETENAVETQEAEKPAQTQEAEKPAQTQTSEDIQVLEKLSPELLIDAIRKALRIDEEIARAREEAIEATRREIADDYRRNTDGLPLHGGSAVSPAKGHSIFDLASEARH